jgi:DNA polymerase III sliding clamp (beta) subunit (PCNA family)
LAALASVRFALPPSPDPALGAILFDIGPTSVTLVVSDRYRMAVSELLVGDRCGPSAMAAVPQDRLPELEQFLLGEDTVTVDVHGQVIRWTAEDRQLELRLSSEEFPEYRSIVNVLGTRRVITDVASARAVLASRPLAHGTGIDGSSVDVAILTTNESGALVVRPDTDTADCVVVNVEFLLEAMEANPTGQLFLDLASPITPLAIRFPHKPGTFSVLMPTRLV